MPKGYPQSGVNKGWFTHGKEPIKLDEDYISQEYLKGRSIEDISKELKVSRQTIHRRLIKNNIPRRIGDFQKGHKTLPGVEKGWFKSGYKSKAWKGGRRIDKNRYVEIWTGKSSHGYEKEHRLVMEKHLGRKLKFNEVVHHINGNRSDNRIENLQLFESQSKHMSNHIK